MKKSKEMLQEAINFVELKLKGKIDQSTVRILDEDNFYWIAKITIKETQIDFYVFSTYIFINNWYSVEAFNNLKEYCIGTK